MKTYIDSVLEEIPRHIIDAVYEATDGGCNLTRHQLIEDNNAYIDLEKFLKQKLQERDQDLINKLKVEKKGTSDFISYVADDETWDIYKKEIDIHNQALDQVISILKEG